MEKLMDLRNIIAAFFLVVGLILLVVYFTANNKSTYFFVNLYAGIAYIVFALLMFITALRKSA